MTTMKITNKKLLGALLMAGTLILSACTNTTELEDSYKAEQSIPLAFDIYMSRNAQTRAAAIGDISSSRSLAQKKGFGVFGYYTEGERYAAGQEAFYPNFFYNQQVKGTDEDTPTWSYAPIKYWPNNNALADNAGATGENKGLVSFFAYAPYADAVGITGIIGLPTNTDKVDPVLSYKLAADGKNVDLLWGTSKTESSIAGSWEGRTDDNTGETLTGGKGKVNANLTKQATNGKVSFNFKHALAKMGLKVQLDLDDNKGNINGGELSTDKNKTKVSVESVTITTDGVEGAPKIQGKLNLATGVWELEDVTTAFTCALRGDELNQNILDPGEVSGDQPYSKLSTNGTSWVWDKTGVQTASENGVAIPAMDVYALETSEKPILFIPTTTPKFKVNIVYYVNTIDPNLQKYVSRVKNSITKEITFGSAVEMGKAYNLVLHLGLTIVKFSVEVDSWDNVDGITTVNLPINVTDGSEPMPKTDKATKTFTDVNNSENKLTVERDAAQPEIVYPVVGDKTKDTPDGDYTLDDDNIYTVEDGVVTKITPVPDDSDGNQAVDKSSNGVNASIGESKKYF